MSRRRLAVALALVLSVALVGSGATAARVTGAFAERTEQPSIAAAAAPTLAQLIGQKLVIRMSGTTPTRRPARPHRARRGRRGHRLRRQHRRQHPAPGAHRAAPGGGDGRRPAEAAHRRRPGGRLDPARPVGAADDVGQADGHRRADVGRPGAGHGHRVGAPRSRLQRRLRPGRGRAAQHQLVHVHRWAAPSRSTRPRRSRLANAFAAGLESKDIAPTMKHFPGIGRTRYNTDQYVVTLARLEGDAGARPHPVPGRHRRPHPADHAVERDVHGLRQRQRRRLVACRSRSACCATSSGSRACRITDSLERHGQGARHRDLAPRRPGRARRART